MTNQKGATTVEISNKAADTIYLTVTKLDDKAASVINKLNSTYKIDVDVTYYIPKFIIIVPPWLFTSQVAEQLCVELESLGINLERILYGSKHPTGKFPAILLGKENERRNQLCAAIQRRIELNQTKGVQLLEGQLLARGISLEVACTLAEYLQRKMDYSAKKLIESLDESIQEIVFNIYRSVMSVTSS